MALQVELTNVSTAYQNPAEADTCEQYAERIVFALQQQYTRNVQALNSTAFSMSGPVRVQVVVYNGSDNSTCKLLGIEPGGGGLHGQCQCSLLCDNLMRNADCLVMQCAIGDMMNSSSEVEAANAVAKAHFVLMSTLMFFARP